MKNDKKTDKIIRLAIAVACAAWLSGCAAVHSKTADADNSEDAAYLSAGNNGVNDPLEPFNRCVHAFNYTIDGLLLKPAAQIYRGVVPQVVRDRVHDFLANLTSPVIFANALLQGDVEHAFVTLWRFTFNTTLGGAGLFDFAETQGLKARDEDFGQTLGVWGAGSGPYIVLPLIGPSNLRDTVGGVADFMMDPINYTEDEIVLTRSVVSAVDMRERNIEVFDDMERSSIDLYSAMRSAYTQYRDNKIKNGSAKSNWVKP